MSLDIKQGFLYPYQSENRVSAILLPGAIMLAFFIVLFVFIFAGVILAIVISGIGGETVARIAWSGLIMVAVPVFLLVLVGMMALISGYRWELMAQIHEQGYAVPAPQWKSTWKSVYVNGLCLVGYYFLIGLAYFCMLAMLILSLWLMLGHLGRNIAIGASMGVILGSFIVVFFLTPFVRAPVVYSAMQRRAGALLEWEEAFRLVYPRYGRILLVMMIIFFINVFYTGATMILNYLFIGPLVSPFITFAMLASSAHLEAQGFQIGDVQQNQAEDSGGPQ